MSQPYEVLYSKELRVPIKAWTRGVAFEPGAQDQLRRVARLPFVYKWVAVMPDVHAGKGATIGSVIATDGALIPAAVGVDIGCGMIAARTSLTASVLPDSLHGLREAIEKAVPHGRTDNGGPNDRGAWHSPPAPVLEAWKGLYPAYEALVSKYPTLNRGPALTHLGTLGTGNHFIELCLDEQQQVWLMLHSGSRGVGNRMGTLFIDKAKEQMKRWFIELPDPDLAYLPQNTELFTDYLTAVHWAQEYAALNRQLMLEAILGALQSSGELPSFELIGPTVSCHHNYVARENHYGKNVWVTRKGAVRAREGDLGIIPGSMGDRSYIVQGRGQPESFCSCSHGAGRRVSRAEAKRSFSLEQHIEATKGIECRKDADVLDETPQAYKPIDDVMNAQQDLVETLFTLKQVLCVKG